MTWRVVFFLGLGGYVLLSIVAYFTWAIWIARFVERYGMKPAFFLWFWAPLLDYQRARRIARKIGSTPWFLRLFRRVSWGALFFMLTSAVAGLMTLFISQ